MTSVSRGIEKGLRIETECMYSETKPSLGWIGQICLIDTDREGNIRNKLEKIE